MAELKLPLRPKDDNQHRIPKLDKQILVYRSLMQCSNSEAFLRFHPEYATDDWKSLNKSGTAACKQFFTWNKNKAFAEDYEATLAEFFGRKQTNKSSEFDDFTEEDKAEAVKLFRSKVYKAMRTVDETDIDALADVGGLAKSTKVLSEEEEQEIRPLRFLPSRCGECRYRISTESMVLNGEMLDMCQYCKCRRIAEENGYQFNDGKDLLEIPEDVIRELEEKNDIKLLDIINGKIQN